MQTVLPYMPLNVLVMKHFLKQAIKEVKTTGGLALRLALQTFPASPLLMPALGIFLNLSDLLPSYNHLVPGS